MVSCNRQDTRKALDHVEQIIVDGLRHGFFEYAISCEVVHGRKRQLVIRAGKSHKFTIPRSVGLERAGSAAPVASHP